MPSAPLARIEVLENYDTFGDESVHYDQAVVFSRSDGYRFSLSAQQSIAGGLEFADHESDIENLLEEYPQRLSLA